MNGNLAVPAVFRKRVLQGFCAPGRGRDMKSARISVELTADSPPRDALSAEHDMST